MVTPLLGCCRTRAMMKLRTHDSAASMNSALTLVKPTAGRSFSATLSAMRLTIVLLIGLLMLVGAPYAMLGVGHFANGDSDASHTRRCLPARLFMAGD